MTQPAYQFSHHEADGLAVYTDGVEVLHAIPAGPAPYATHTPWQLRALRVQNRRNHAKAAGFPEFQATLDATMAEIDAALEHQRVLSLQAPAKLAAVTAEIIAGYRAKRIGVVS
jgi:hypothetical protein